MLIWGDCFSKKRPAMMHETFDMNLTRTNLTYDEANMQHPYTLKSAEKNIETEKSNQSLVDQELVERTKNWRRVKPSYHSIIGLVFSIMVGVFSNIIFNVNFGTSILIGICIELIAICIEILVKISKVKRESK